MKRFFEDDYQTITNLLMAQNSQNKRKQSKEVESFIQTKYC